jgi:hypothetical protein
LQSNEGDCDRCFGGKIMSKHLHWGRSGKGATWHLWRVMDNDAEMVCRNHYYLQSEIEWAPEAGILGAPVRDCCQRCERIIDDVDMSDL